MVNLLDDHTKVILAVFSESCRHKLANRCNKLDRFDDPYQGVAGFTQLKENVTYTYGDHWRLTVDDGGAISITNDYEEHMMRVSRSSLLNLMRFAETLAIADNV